jgi:regulator of cell morphogenesis and NO signaling
MKFTGSDAIGAIVAAYPGASNLFKAHKIDFCCGGNRKLSEVLQEQGEDEEAFIARLNQMYEETQANRQRYKDWRQAPSDELIDHIVNTHHAYLNSELPLLSEFVTKILRVHGAKHAELAQLHKVFHQIKMELEQHLIAEEETVFPLIRKAEQTGAAADRAEAAAAIEAMEADHSAVGDLLKEMRDLTSDYRLPEDACRTYTLTFQKLEELESDLFEHIHLENNVLFPRMTA